MDLVKKFYESQSLQGLSVPGVALPTPAELCSHFCFGLRFRFLGSRPLLFFSLDMLITPSDQIAGMLSESKP